MEHDAQLIAALRRRDPDAFAQLFESYSDRIYRLALGLLENETEADGIVQETFLKLIERLDQFEGRAKLGTWLYRVAYNASIDKLRARRPLVSLDETGRDDQLPVPVILVDWGQWPERLIGEAELNAYLDRAIASLPEAYRAVFLLREVEGLSTQETADVAGLTEANVKVRLHRARLMLRERLAEYMHELV